MKKKWLIGSLTLLVIALATNITLQLAGFFQHSTFTLLSVPVATDDHWNPVGLLVAGVLIVSLASIVSSLKKYQGRTLIALLLVVILMPATIVSLFLS